MGRFNLPRSLLCEVVTPLFGRCGMLRVLLPIEACFNGVINVIANVLWCGDDTPWTAVIACGELPTGTREAQCFHEVHHLLPQALRSAVPCTELVVGFLRFA